MQGLIPNAPHMDGSPAATAARLPPSVRDGQDDRVDVRAALLGDGDAYARLIGRYQAEIAAYMWRFTRDRVRWEELVHEVFVEAYLSLGSYQGRAPLLHWLRRIATRVGYRFWKQRSRRRETALPLEQWTALREDRPGPETAREAAQLVHAVLEQLAPRDRLVITLLHLEECSVEEIARLTGWSRAMVKVQAHRARKKLGKLLEEMAREGES